MLITESEEKMDPAEKKNLVHNLAVNFWDGGFFGFALGFASFTTIIPLFFSTMTDSAVLIGLIPAIHNMGWQLPQLLTAKKIKTLEYLKPYVLQMTLHERIPFLGLALVAWMLPVIGNKIGLGIAFLLLVWQGVGSGMTANGWQIMISKVIPSQYLSTFFGFQSAIFNLCASLTAVAAGFFLERLDNRSGFTVCFLSACVMFFISWFGILKTREPGRKVDISDARKPSIWESTVRIIKSDKVFLWYLIARNLSHFGLMASAFYTVYAVKFYHMSVVTVGVMTSLLLASQMAATPVLGWLSDRWSKKWILVVGMSFAFIGPLMAVFVDTIQGFYPIFILTGISNTVMFLGMAYSLDFGSVDEKPVYVGMANTLIAPSTILAPVLGGWLADSFSYQSTFLFAAIAALLTSIVFVIFVSDPVKNKKIIQ